ncbi:MAG TPA: hypothetical protein VIG33_00020 [Pseudobdellovibrionaceae bacterium]|jgi:hypothetical protein
MNPQIPEDDSLKVKHYFQMGIAVGLVVAAVSGFIWFRSDSSTPKANAAEVAASDTPEDSGSDLHLDEELDVKVGADPTATPENKKAEAVDLNKVSEFFARSMKQLATCMALNNAGTADRLDPSSESLMAAVKADLGDPVLRSQDWITWNLRVNSPAGSEERRIRIETDYSENDQAARHLLYFKLDAQGQPTLIPLPSEQSKDPSESFIASLQKDGEVYQEEKGERVYFDGGQEMMLTEKNGKIDDLEVSNGVKTFRCAGIISSSPSCKCY